MLLVSRDDDDDDDHRYVGPLSPRPLPHPQTTTPTHLRRVALEHALADREGLVRVEHLPHVHRLPLQLCRWFGWTIGVGWCVRGRMGCVVYVHAFLPAPRTKRTDVPILALSSLRASLMRCSQHSLYLASTLHRIGLHWIGLTVGQTDARAIHISNLT